MTNQITPTSVLIINRLSDAARADEFGFEVETYASNEEDYVEGLYMPGTTKVLQDSPKPRLAWQFPKNTNWRITLNDNPDSPNYWRRMLPIPNDILARWNIPSMHCSRRFETYIITEENWGGMEWAVLQLKNFVILARPLNGRIAGWFDYEVQDKIS